jgi:membrane protein DedA with SNARE-associated domain
MALRAGRGPLELGRMLQDFVKTVTDFAQSNMDLLLPLVLLIAFLECLAFVSILAPATVLFTALGAVAGAAGIGMLPLALTATIGSVAGYWVSYWLGLWLGPSILERWPLNRRPELVRKTHDFFERWGAPGILFSHFWGQIRPLAPLVAGIVRMSPVPFHIANLIGSLGWSFGVFYASGTVGGWLK